MTSKEQVDETLENLAQRQVEVAKAINPDDEDIEEVLLKNIKEQIRISLDNLNTLYKEFVDKDDCTLTTVLEFIPLMSVNALINAAQLGVSQEEYYLIVDYYLEKYELIAYGDE